MISSPFTFSIAVPTPFGSSQPASRDNVLCQYCHAMVRDSRIIHLAPKIDLRHTTDVDQPGVQFDDAPPDTQSDVPKFEVFDHYPNLGALKTSARACHLCALLCADDPKYPEMRFDSSNNTSYVMKVLRADANPEGPGVLKLQVRGVRDNEATYLTDGQPRPRDRGTLRHGRTDHAEVLNLAKRWLNDCLASHSACHARTHPTSSWSLPTRLIRVTGFGTSVFSMKLCLGKSVAPGTRYLALSHCWGGADIVKLTQGSLGSFLSDIPVRLLPQNFKDAAAVTVFLGYEYLWIDSLCIIQDSTEDWKQEAAIMGNVYRYSLCTLAALGAKDPHGGFFVDRNHLSVTPCQLFPDSATRTGVYAENWRDPGPNSNQNQFKERLLTRGWVVQESALSPRTLYFGSNMIYWACTVANGSELDQQLSTLALEGNIKSRFYSLLDMTKDGDYHSWQHHWWRIVHDYTACSLSFPSDRWTAISGLATMVANKAGSRLVFGLWEMKLSEEMMWEVSGSRQDVRVEGQGPSWSWLSVDGPVHRMAYNTVKYFRVDAAVSLQTHPPDDSKLFIRGRMVQVKFNVRYRGDGTSSYTLRFINPAADEVDTWHSYWKPDSRPDPSWEMWAMRFIVDDRVMEEAGIVLRRVDGPEGDVWTRAGAYGVRLGHLPNGRAIWDLGKRQSITLE